MRRVYLFCLIMSSILSLQGIGGCQIENEYVSGEIIVRFKPDAFDEEGELISESIQELNDKYGLISMEALFKRKASGELAYIYKLKFPEELDIMELIQEYEDDPSIIYAEPNYTMQIFKEGQDAD